MQEKVYKKWIKDIDELRARILTAWDKIDQSIIGSQTVAHMSSCMHALELKADTLNTHCVSNVFC